MDRPAVTTLLPGFLLSSDQGNAALCGVYLVRGREGGAERNVLYDCAHLGRRSLLLRALAGAGLTPADVDAVVLSHCHWDHVQNLDLFERARVLVHPRELAHLAGAPRPGIPRWAPAILDGADVRETGEGDGVLPGVRVLDLPGHTPGSIGLAVDTGGGTAVLTGDAVATAASLRSGRCLGAPADPEAATASVARVAALADVVHPGHDLSFRLTPDGGTEHLTGPVPITFRAEDPEALRAAVRFVGRGTGVTPRSDRRPRRARGRPRSP